MRFKIERTSHHGESIDKPCDEAYESDRRVSKYYQDDDEASESIEEVDIDYEIEISTLEELMRFIEKYGNIVLSKKRLEIYDEYRE